MWSINPVYFSIGPLQLRWYGLLMAAAIAAGFFLAYRFAGPRLGIAPGQIENLLPWLVVGGFLGARLYSVAFTWDYFRVHPEEIFAIWHGGLSIYGSIIGGTLAIIIFAKANKASVLSLLDAIAVVLPLGQAIGRVGNFFNYESFGSPTALPWKMYVPPAFRPAEYLGERYFHPAFLYEALWDFAVFGALVYLLHKRPPAPRGYFVGIYLILYSLGRFWIESVRLDSFFIAGIRADQITALTAMLGGAAIIATAYGLQKNP